MGRGTVIPMKADQCIYKTMLMAISMLQKSQELLQQGIEQLYEEYRVYATNTPSAWMQAIDAAAVRQVQVLADSIWHQECSWWLVLDISPASCIIVLSPETPCKVC